MPQTYRLSFVRRAVNAIMGGVLRLGVPVGNSYLLTTRGRKSGQPQTTPVTLVVDGDQRWIVAPYGPVNWVRNARAAGEVTLSRGHQSETVPVEELDPFASAPILKRYLTAVRIVQPFFDATPASDLSAFEREAVRHPVFRVAEHR